MQATTSKDFQDRLSNWKIGCPFKVRRIYYIYDVPSGAIRSGHAHKNLEQVIIAIKGSFSVTLDDGVSAKSFYLNRPYYDLYVPPMFWRSLQNFSNNCVALSIVSDYYDDSDYIRDYSIFKKIAAQLD